MQRADFSRICNREMFTCISSNRVQPLCPQACIGRDAKKSNFLAVWTGGSFLITKWHTAIPILWWFIFIHGKKRYFVQPRFKLHNTLFCIFFCSNPHPPRFCVLVPRLTRAICHYEFGVLWSRHNNYRTGFLTKSQSLSIALQFGQTQLPPTSRRFKLFRISRAESSQKPRNLGTWHLHYARSNGYQ